MTSKKEITLDSLTSALKTVYGDKTDVPLLIFQHWIKNNYDLREAMPAALQEIERNYLEHYYGSAASLEHEDALALLDVYGRHLYSTTTASEREQLAIAAGYTPFQFKIREEEFSLRELMQAIKLFDGNPPQLSERIWSVVSSGIARSG